MIVTNNSKHGYKIAAAIPRVFNPSVDAVISHVDQNGMLLGGVIYDNYTRNAVFIHQAGFSRMWLTGAMIFAAFDFPFNKLKVWKLCGTIPSYNEELLKFNLRLGFELEATIKDAYPEGDLLILSMTRDKCKWIKGTKYER